MAPRRVSRATFAALAIAALSGFAREAGAAKPAPRAPVPIAASATVSRCADCPTLPVDVAAGPFGTFLAAWTDTMLHVFRRVFDADGNGGDDARVGNASQEALAGIAGDDEGWLVGWYQPGRVWARRLAGDGSGPMVSTQVDESGLGDDHGTALVPAGDGTLMVWNRSTPGDAPDQVVARRLDRGGTPIGDEQVVGQLASPTTATACGFPNGKSVVVWTTYAGPLVDGFAPTGVSLRRLGADGVPLGAEQVVAKPTLVTFTTAPSVVCKPDGSFIVAWNGNQKPAKKGFDVLWQRFDAAGKAKGKPAVLNGGTAGDQFEPALLVQPDGTVLAVWNDDAGGASVLTGRWIAANGKLLGSDFALLAAEPGEAAHRPRLALMPGSGRFALAWWEGMRARYAVFAF